MDSTDYQEASPVTVSIVARDGYITPHGFDRGGENTQRCASCPGSVPCRCMALGLVVLPSLN